MKKNYLSLAAVLLFGSSTLMADTLEKAFKSSSVEGSIGLYTQHTDPKMDVKNGFSNGYATIGYETGTFHNISLGMSAMGSAKFGEKVDGTYNDAIADKGIIHQAFIKYEEGELIKAVVGRQEVDFVWMTDFIEGATLELGHIDNLVLTMAWAKKQAVVGGDEITAFENVNGNKGVYMLDAKYTPVEWLEINPFYYHAQDLVKAPGAKVTLSFEPQEELKTKTMLAYTKGNSNIAREPNGAVTHVEQSIEFMGIVAAVGYVRTDKNGTAGLDSFGDQMPFEEGNFALAEDSKTPYVLASYEIERTGLGLDALYGETKYKDSGISLKEKELNVGITYEIVEGLEASLIYVDVKNNDTANPSNTYKAIKAGIEYTF